MKMYHGSKYEFEYIERRQAGSVNNVPKDELLNAIYLTPDYGRALAIGCFPEGENFIDEENKTITFGNPYLFNPDQDIYIYVVDSVKIPVESLRLGDNGFDYVANEDKVFPLEIKKVKAREILKFFTVTNWIENRETKPFKIK